jgi:hypothetical protein
MCFYHHAHRRNGNRQGFSQSVGAVHEPERPLLGRTGHFYFLGRNIEFFSSGIFGPGLSNASVLPRFYRGVGPAPINTQLGFFYFIFFVAGNQSKLAGRQAEIGGQWVPVPTRPPRATIEIIDIADLPPDPPRGKGRTGQCVHGFACFHVFDFF